MYLPISLGPRYSVQIKKKGMGWLYSTHGVRRFACRVFIRKPSGKSCLGRSRHRWQDNAKMDLQQVRFGA